MAIFKRATSPALILAGAMLAGCAVEGNDGLFTTGSLTGQSAEAKSDPQCISLATRIEALRKDGIPEKIEKAAAKRYKLTKTDLSKADDLNKANAEFQTRCSTVKGQATAAATPAAPAAADPAAKTAAKKATTKAVAKAQ